MTERTNGGGGPVGRMPDREELALDDAFLDALACGDSDAVGAGSCGTDSALADLFAAAAVRADGPMPAPPALPADWAPEADADVDDAVTAAFAAVPADARDDGTRGADAGGYAPAGGSVTPLRRPRRGRGGDADRVAGIPLPGRLTTALLGAAAASVLIVGGLSAIVSAQPGGVLWPVRQQLTGQDSVTVELAATLEHADAAAGAGDAEEARRLMAYAERLLAEVDAHDRDRMHAQVMETKERIRYVVVPGDTETTTVTTTSDRTAPRETETRTVRETVTEQATVTVTERPAPAPAPDAGGAAPAPGGEDPVSGEPLRSTTPTVPAPPSVANAPSPATSEPASRSAGPSAEDVAGGIADAAESAGAAAADYVN
ncbi:hypothetical protein [Corynebacterium sp. 335C]